MCVLFFRISQKMFSSYLWYTSCNQAEYSKPVASENPAFFFFFGGGEMLPGEIDNLVANVSGLRESVWQPKQRIMIITILKAWSNSIQSDVGVQRGSLTRSRHKSCEEKKAQGRWKREVTSSANTCTLSASRGLTMWPRSTSKKVINVFKMPERRINLLSLTCSRHCRGREGKKEALLRRWQGSHQRAIEKIRNPTFSQHFLICLRSQVNW